MVLCYEDQRNMNNMHALNLMHTWNDRQGFAYPKIRISESFDLLVSLVDSSGIYFLKLGLSFATKYCINIQSIL